MADQAIPQSPPYSPNLRTLPTEWLLFYKELLRRMAELENRVTKLETP